MLNPARTLIVLAALTLPSLASAGPNAGGVLILHTNDSIVYTDSAGSYCGQPGLTLCSAADTRSDEVDVDVVVFALAAFPASAAPRLAGVAFGVDYDPLAIQISDWESCGDFELPGGDWPGPGSTTAITWNEAQLGHLTEIYWFAAFRFDETPAELSLIVGGCGGGMADDAVPAGIDPVADYGTFGFGTDGYLPCPVAPPTLDNFELVPSTVTVYQPCGGSFEVDLNAVDVDRLSSFELCVGYDSARFGLESEIDPAFLESTGLAAVPLDPVPCTSSCQSAGLRVGAGTAGVYEPPSGSGRLARLTLTPLGVGAGPGAICLELAETPAATNPLCLLEALGTPASRAAIDDRTTGEARGGEPALDITHSPFCYGDFDGSGDVTAFDLIQIIAKQRCCDADACYFGRFDVNLLERGNYCASVGDGCIDIVDAQTVAGRWHLGCGDMPRIMPARASGNPPSLRISPVLSSISGAIGDTASITIVVDDAAGLGAYQATVSFDPSVVHVESVQPGSLLGSSGRVVYGVGPSIDNEMGVVHLGACTVNESPGVAGSGVLARIVFRSESCEGSTDLALSQAILTEIDGWPQPLGPVTGASIEVDCASSGVPWAEMSRLELHQNRPNPLTHSTIIPFSIPVHPRNDSNARLAVYTSAGRLVRVLFDGRPGPGEQRVRWDGRDAAGRSVPSGAYFYRLSWDSQTLERQVLVTR